LPPSILLAGETACPTQVSRHFVGRRPIRDRAEAWPKPCPHNSGLVKLGEVVPSRHHVAAFAGSDGGTSRGISIGPRTLANPRCACPEVILLRRSTRAACGHLSAGNKAEVAIQIMMFPVERLRCKPPPQWPTGSKILLKSNFNEALTIAESHPNGTQTVPGRIALEIDNATFRSEIGARELLTWRCFSNLNMSKVSIATLSLVIAWIGYSPARAAAGKEPSGSSHKQTAAGATLAHFAKVDDGVYKGSQPRTDADYRLLQSRHVKYILNLELLPFLQEAEQEKAKRYGMEVMHARINASPVPPSEEHIAMILATLRDRRYRPIYFHCALGRDRTALVAALYKMYFLGMSQRDAWRYMQQAGFKESWLRDGLKKYLLSHPTAPANFAHAQ
jgi:hypothetical protein